jgi:hypothetical protein
VTIFAGARTPAESAFERASAARLVSLLSDDGVSIEDIADLVGHAGSSVTEKVNRHRLRPVLLKGLWRWTGSFRVQTILLIADRNEQPTRKAPWSLSWVYQRTLVPYRVAAFGENRPGSALRPG